MSDPGPFRVLVVEPTEEEAKKLVEVLSPRFEVVVCHSAEEALARLSSANAHVVCSSYDMPGMDGTRFLGRVASLPDPPCFLLITSAAEMKNERLEGLSGVIMRPYDSKALVERVSRLCRVAETRRKVDSARSSIGRDRSGLGSR